MPGCELSNSPKSVEPLLQDVTISVLTTAEDSINESFIGRGGDSLAFFSNITRIKYKSKTNKTEIA